MGKLMHTPGPWRSSDQYVGTMKSMASICECKDRNGFFEKDAVSIANARLIASAPELLAALVEMVRGDELAIQEAEDMGVPFPESMLVSYRMAVAAIAKATNE